uniref:Putative glucosidase ii beta subunit-like protein n=1 Tax=Anopheles braziliensis TaxID=58242 RepID=A0A2M3ZL09_9DIPT
MRKTWVKRDNIYYKPFYKQKLKLTLIGVLGLGVLFFVYQLVYISQFLPSSSSSSSSGSGSALLAAQMRPPLHSNSNNPVASAELGADGNRPSPSPGANRAVYGSSNTGLGQHQYAYVERIGNHERMILRGIRLRDLDRYTEPPASMSRAPFRCLQTGRELSWDRVNDDYCDCPEDGSDEPSTSACTNGRFYCRFQKRHRTGRGRDRSIPSGWVNDGVCDCCDGSDEWLPTGGGNLAPLRPCPNSCSTKYFL